MSFFTDVLITFGTRVLILGLSSASSVLIARTLGPEGKGIYSLVILVPTMTAALAGMGINISNIFLIGKKKYPIRDIIGNAFFASLCFGGVTTITLLILVPYLNAYIMKDASQVYFYATIPLIPLILASENIYYILIGCREMVRWSKLRLVQDISYLAILIIFIYLFELAVYGAILAYVFGFLISLFFGIYILIESGFGFGLTMNRQIFFDALKFGLKYHLGTISQLFNYRFDMLIIAALLTTSELGLYSVAIIVGEMIWIIPNSLSQILYPKTASSNEEEADRFTPIICRNTLLLTAVASLGMYTICSVIIPWLFTIQFLPSVMALKLLLPGIFSFSICKVLTTDLTGRGFPQYATYPSLVSLILTIILDFLLIPYFGINGASLASSISYIAGALVAIYLFKKITRIRLFDILILKTNDIVMYQRLLKGAYG